MIDRREAILAQLMAIFAAVPGILRVGRNMEDVSAAYRPAIVMHDAAESSEQLSGRPRQSPKDLMVLSPQIYLLLGARQSVVGSEVSALRALIIPAIYNDLTLLDLIGARRGNGDIHYTGCGLDTTPGENREARLELSFDFTYVLDIRELTD